MSRMSLHYDLLCGKLASSLQSLDLSSGLETEESQQQWYLVSGSGVTMMYEPAVWPVLGCLIMSDSVIPTHTKHL